MVKISTRERFIRSATELFQRNGYAATGTNEILEHAKAPRGSLYHHFPGGKADLAYACVSWVTDAVIEEIRSLRLKGKNSKEVVESIALGVAKWLKERKWQEGPLLPTLVHEFAASDEKMMAEIESAYGRIQSEFVQMLVVEGRAEEMAVRQTHNIMSILAGATNLARVLRSPAPLENCSDVLNI